MTRKRTYRDNSLNYLFGRAKAWLLRTAAGRRHPQSTSRHITLTVSRPTLSGRTVERFAQRATVQMIHSGAGGNQCARSWFQVRARPAAASIPHRTGLIIVSLVLVQRRQVGRRLNGGTLAPV
jgi:hypothetical protein